MKRSIWHVTWRCGFAILSLSFMTDSDLYLALSSRAEQVVSKDKVYPCGTMALTILLRLEGYVASEEAVNSLLPVRPQHSLGELRDAGSHFGLVLRGSRLGTGKWPLDRPALVLLNRNGSGHFVVVRSVGHSGNLVQVIDPTHATEVMDYERIVLSRSWTGYALVPVRVSDKMNLYILSTMVPVSLVIVFSLLRSFTCKIRRVIKFQR